MEVPMIRHQDRDNKVANLIKLAGVDVVQRANLLSRSYGMQPSFNVSGYLASRPSELNEILKRQEQAMLRLGGALRSA